METHLIFERISSYFIPIEDLLFPKYLVQTLPDGIHIKFILEYSKYETFWARKPEDLLRK